ncbi:hypothetical protein NG895_00825 [Aeoliella sp. ICT_H6.2]|uniref:DUF11 domain-containing protein n=1 Tax=Aeoliella straminimaris TaxID=2954799 RepID=A0A9X2F686_9BACT|nr:hypothetical protein [Aeoliella straminimaris]MCO6042438.1 hypothetical protein [Aeoliella straminimaris]
MSKPKSRRRVLLPAILATTLLAGGGVGGFLWLGTGGSSLSEETQNDLDAGFASAQEEQTEEQGNDTLEGLAGAFKREQATKAQPTEVEQPVENDSAESLAVDTSMGELDAVPEVPADRYAAADAPVEPAPVPPLPAVDDRYAALEPTEAADASLEEMSDEPHGADELVARGQSPVGALPAAEPMASTNPLRGGSESASPFGNDAPTSAAPSDGGQALPANNQAAQNAFTTPVAMPMEQTQGGYRQLETPVEAPAPADNPLRTASVQPEPAGFDGAQPLAAAQPIGAPPAEDGYEPAPMDSAPIQSAPIEPMVAEQDNYRGGGFSEPAADAFAASAPVERAPEGASSPMEAYDAQPSYGQSGGAQPVEAQPSYESQNSFTSQPATMPSGAAIDEGTGRPGERALEGPQRPSLVLQKFAPEEIQVGKQCKFVIKVRNIGQRPADNVVVEDEVPQGTRLVAAQPQAETSGPSLAWQLGTLSPGEERTMEVELMPTEEGEIGSVAKVTFASHASAKTRCTRPQLALRMSAPGEVLIGRQQRITIELHNPGTGDATNVMLLENVPENVRHQAGPALELEVGTLRAGETRRLELVLTAEKPGVVQNVLTARADGNLQVQQQVDFEVISPALSVSVDGPSRRYLERQATYTVNVDNPGTAPAKDVQLVTKLPKGMQFVRANNLGEYDVATHSVYWSLAELPQGQQGSVELVAMPIQSGDHAIEVEGRAREGLEDRTTQPVRIEGLAAIMFEVHDAQDPIEVGGSTSYEIRVVNQGSKAASNVQVTALIPPGMTVTGAQGETRHHVEAEGVVFEPLARLAPKADTVYRVDVQGKKPGDQRVLVEVRTDDITQPVRKEESTRVFGEE